MDGARLFVGNRGRGLVVAVAWNQTVEAAGASIWTGIPKTAGNAVGSVLTMQFAIIGYAYAIPD
jgi:hypothetical protein